MIAECATYYDGRRVGSCGGLSDALAACRHGEGFLWLSLVEPSEEELREVADELELHPLAVEDAVHAHQRPKLERYGNTIIVVLKPGRYVDHIEVIELGQVLLFVGEHFVVTVRHGNLDVVAQVRDELEAEPDRLALGPLAVVHAIADRVVDDYLPALHAMGDDIDEVEGAVFTEPRAEHTARIFKLKREVLEFRGAVDLLLDPLEALMGQLPFSGDDVLQPYFRDVHDHLVRASHRLAVLDGLLDATLSANVALVGMRQNEDMRKISAWVAIIAMPTLIAGIYGMNFEHMPELEWWLGYPFALGLMAVCCVLLFRNFRRRGWL